ncbi:hypothetical protein HOB50_02340, partial [Candidatus Woesearchaeota archaeon]|nr:hypothetical protein [Candidatus Woesearchaeota archaeon]MBT7133394.1 hypothetical protein [Candidatus Woesearchaeota archaeon]MBT7441309.1 hypothetical protein [Candidatus Woesearchaeota archaeon]
MKKLGVLVVGMLLLLTALAQANTDPGHPASQIDPGTIASALTITSSGDVGAGIDNAAEVTDDLTVKNVLRLLPLTSAPATCNEGSMYYDSTEHKIYVCDNTGWNEFQGPPGVDGTDGTDGVGISSATYESATGILTLTYSDATTFSTTDLRGATGATGDSCTVTDNGDGTHTITCGATTTTLNDGTNGIDGTNGVDGSNGIDGTNGVGIDSATYESATGILTLTYSDATTFSTTDLRGTAGTDGVDGTDGDSCTITNNGDGTHTITCGATTTTLNDGTNGVNGIDGVDGDSCTITNNGDGTHTVTCGATTTTLNDGTNGVDGTNGINGVDGTNGVDGVGISSATYASATGILTLTYSDGSTLSTTDLRGTAGTDGTNGADGANGADGTDGVGIS